MSDANDELVLDRAALVADGAGIEASPGVVLRRGATVIAAGSPQSIGVPSHARVVEHARAAILPALGNAHAHLDLTDLRPEPFDGNFPRWLGRVREFRLSAGQEGACASLMHGAQLSLAGGVALVGDVVGAPLSNSIVTATELLCEGGVSGVAFLELFGAGSTRDRALRAMDELERIEDRPGAAVRIGLQPHAPFSTCDEVMVRALRAERPFSIHLAETSDEVEYALHGSGPLREMLDAFGARATPGNAATAAEPFVGEHPVAWLSRCVRDAERSRAAAARTAPRIAVHLNEVNAEFIALFASLSFSAVYCPRATAYFGRQGMPWRTLRSAGVRVALGTDGRLCLDTPSRISTLDEMRFLAARDGATLSELLPLATTEVARALGFDEPPFTLAPGAKPGLLLLPCGDDPRSDVLTLPSDPNWLVRGEPVR